ncbi:site-specific DNA-methyltransferase [Sphingosinicella sp. YJ22]|uniref:site-specific DNA-methyltransferase n=1 Tax=Sphingosinicella sp. YJ22 TaxID=1104780 RepID=UPI00140C4616|nr:site-specific DNA-methyltransferase [Sphingosinicella sp. YJ22]
MEFSTGEDLTRLSFRDWTGERALATIGTNAGSVALPFQDWRRFKEAFAPELVEMAVSETPGRVERIVDPFGGSGTTALAAQFLGINPTTIEVNPYLADLIEAKISRIDLEAAALAFARVVERAGNSVAPPQNPFPDAPRTFVEPGVDNRYIFSKAVAARLVAYRDAIMAEANEGIRRLFRVVLASAAVPVSNVTISGKGRRYRSNWQSRRVSPAAVDSWFRDGVLQALYDLRRFADRSCQEYTLLRGDARQLVNDLPQHQLAVFSPPYPNSFDYTDVYNVELWALGYLSSRGANTALRNATLRSHVQIHRDMTADDLAAKTLGETVRKLESVSERLWNRHIPSMVAAYASDMAVVIRGIGRAMPRGGRAYIVVGDSRYAEVDVPVAAILAELAPGLGFEPLRVEPFRSMRVSPQQGGRPQLSESLLVLGRR